MDKNNHPRLSTIRNQIRVGIRLTRDKLQCKHAPVPSPLLTFFTHSDFRRAVECSKFDVWYGAGIFRFMDLKGPGVDFQYKRVKKFVNRLLRGSNVFRSLIPFEKLIINAGHLKGQQSAVYSFFLSDEVFVPVNCHGKETSKRR